MAHCKIIFEGKTYVNAPLYRAAYGVGDGGFLKAVAKSEIKAKTIFDDTIYQVTSEQMDRCELHDPVTQNVDKQIQQIEVVIDDEGLRTIMVPKSLLRGVIRYEGFVFIRLRDIRDRAKFTIKHRLPLVQVCGSIYVAINAKNSTAKHPVVVKVGAA